MANTIASGTVGVANTIASGSVSTWEKTQKGTVDAWDTTRKGAVDAWDTTRKGAVNLFSGKSVSGHASSRRRHAECECPDHYPEGDSLSYKCERRRLRLMYTQYGDVTENPDAVTGMAVEPLVMNLRQVFDYLQRVRFDLSDRLARAETFIDTTTQVTAINALKRVLNEEALMSESVNNAWVTLLNINDRTNMDDTRILNELANVTANISAFFSKYQSIEENETFFNLRLVTGTLTEQITSMVQKLNTMYAKLGNVFDDVGAATQLSSDDTTQLGDSLGVVADQVQDKIDLLTPDMPSAIAAREIEGKRSSLSRDWATMRSNGIISMHKNFQAKNNQLYVSSRDSISGQKNDTDKIFVQTSAATNAAITAVKQNYINARPIRLGSFNTVEDLITSTVQNMSTDFVARAGKNSHSLIAASAPLDELGDGLKDTVRESARRVYNSEAAFEAEKTSATERIAASLADDKSPSVLGAAKITSDGVVDATGTSSMVDAMSNEYAIGLQKNLDQDQSMAQKSIATQNSLGTASNTAGALIGGASDIVARQAGDSMGSLLNSMSTGLVPAEGGNVNSIKSRVDDFKAMSSIAADKTVQGGAVWSGIADLGLSDMSLAQSAMSSIDAIRQSMISGQPVDSKQVDDALAGTASQLASAQDVLAGILSPSLKMANTNVDQISFTSLFSPLSQMQAGFDISGSRQDRQSTDAVGKLSAAGSALMQTGESARSSLAAQATSQAETLNNGKSGVDFTAAALTGSGATMMSSQAQSLSSAASEQESEIYHLSESDLVEVRSLAASIEAVNRQMNAFLSGTATGDLFNDVQRLPLLIQRVLMGLARFQDTSTNSVSGAKKLSDNAAAMITAMSSQLGSFNSSGIDKFGGINSAFNQSGSNLLADLHQRFAKLADDYVQAHSGVAGTVAAVAAKGQAAEIATLSKSSSDALDSLRAEISNVAGSATVSPGTVGPDASEAAGESANAVALAATDAQTVSNLMRTLGDTGNSLVKNVRSFGSDGIADAVAIVEQSDADTSLSSTVRGKGLSMFDRQATSISADAIATVSDYELAAQSDIAVKKNQASFVYNSVLAAKAQVQTAIGSLMSHFSANQTSATLGIAADTASRAVQSNVMRQLMAGLLSAYEAYLKSQESEFANDEVERNSYMHSTALAVENQIETIDNAMNDSERELGQKARELAADRTTSNTQIEDTMSRIQSQLTDWSDNTLESIAEIPAMIPRTTDLGQIDSLVKQLALTAAHSIEESGKVVPDRLNQIANR